MSSNFLDTSGACVGIDAHTYYGAGAKPVEMPMFPHAVAWSHSWKSRDWRISGTVTTCAHRVLQSNWAMLFVIHVPFPLASPHPMEVIQLGAVIAAASATPQLTAHKVTNQGNALCIAISGSFGLNLDCSDLISFSVDQNSNTVMTQPTLGDYVSAILSAGLSALYAAKGNSTDNLFSGSHKTELGALASVAVALLQNILDAVDWEPGEVVFGKITTAIQQAIDGE